MNNHFIRAQATTIMTIISRRIVNILPSANGKNCSLRETAVYAVRNEIIYTVVKNASLRGDCTLTMRIFLASANVVKSTRVRSRYHREMRHAQAWIISSKEEGCRSEIRERLL